MGYICSVWYNLPLGKPYLPSSHFPSASIFHCSSFSNDSPGLCMPLRSGYMELFSPLPCSQARPHVDRWSLKMSKSKLQTLGSHSFAESNCSHQLLLWLFSIFREVHGKSTALQLSFCSYRLPFQACVLLHGWITLRFFPFSVGFFLLAVTRALLP